MRKKHNKKSEVALTIGHSTRKLEAFIDLLKKHEVELVIDIRTIPRSMHNPQFNKETLPRALRAAGIGYAHMAGLGGLRHSRADSINKAWKNASFRGFADYMQSAEYEDSLQELIELARQHRVALMCAEAVPWRCHRSLIADSLTARGIQVEHIISGVRTQTHSFTPWARIRGSRITYPAETEPASKRGSKKKASTQLSA
jgi:uncharacterized protein (DUF488 family)